ncbi:MAG: D-tyrosyl-tRNA(Tyr) deacylase [Ruminococcaceae bacterium]|nr:D-tyrosyl-tRNA(Tyr) deacylase [Oscillospiraceae bacterium]
MIAVLQRALSAAVRVEGKTVGEIGQGLLVLLGVSAEDTEQDAELLAKKILACRIFTDENDKMNLSVRDVGGSVLVVSNFTLLANYRHGNRPDYMGAAGPERANALYAYFVELIRRDGTPVATGRFGADMRVLLEGEGPVTIVMDSNELKKKKERTQ